jgi:hypothetical protein
MSLFFDMLSAINNPNAQGSVSQLEGIMGSLTSAASASGLDASKLPGIASSLGGLLGPMLQQQGAGGLESMIGQLAAGGSGSTAALQSMIPPQLQQQLVQGVSQATGISPSVLQGLLPTVLTGIMGMLSMGAAKPGTSGTNPLLQSFLQGGSGADLGEVMKFAGRFLNPATP